MTKCQTLPDKMNSISVKQMLFMYFWVVKMSFIAHKKYIILVKRRKIVAVSSSKCNTQSVGIGVF